MIDSYQLYSHNDISPGGTVPEYHLFQENYFACSTQAITWMELQLIGIMITG
jgi:hypothetical protein